MISQASHQLLLSGNDYYRCKLLMRQELGDLIDAEMKRLRTYYVRTSMKESIRTYTHKLLKNNRNKIQNYKRELRI